MTFSDYWLAQWLDENEINSDWEIGHVLNAKSGIKSLERSISKASHKYDSFYAEVLNDSIVAGRKLDLSGSMSCPTYECMRRRIDSTFKRVWHYFDQIVVEGLAPRLLTEQIRTSNEEDLYLTFMMIREQARLLLYLREIGAERFVVFAPKAHAFCQEHWEQHARDLGLAAAIDESRRKKTIKKIIDTSEFAINEDGNGWFVTVTGDYFSEPESKLLIPRKGVTVDCPPSRDDITAWIISTYATAMVSDVSLAQRLGLPLVQPVSLPWITRPYGTDSKRKAEDDAVIRVGLPVFDSLSTQDFLKLREDERPAFEAFRTGRSQAIEAIQAGGITAF
jgi:hypothetical protein